MNIIFLTELCLPKDFDRRIQIRIPKGRHLFLFLESRLQRHHSFDLCPIFLGFVLPTGFRQYPAHDAASASTDAHDVQPLSFPALPIEPRTRRPQRRRLIPHIAPCLNRIRPRLPQFQTIEDDEALDLPLPSRTPTPTSAGGGTGSHHWSLPRGIQKLNVNGHLVPRPGAGVSMLPKDASSPRGKFHGRSRQGNAVHFSLGMDSVVLFGGGVSPTARCVLRSVSSLSFSLLLRVVVVAAIVIQPRDENIPPRQLGTPLGKHDAGIVVPPSHISDVSARRLAVHDGGVLGGRVGHVGEVHDAGDVVAGVEGADFALFVFFVVGVGVGGMVFHYVGFDDGELGEEEGDVGRGFGVGFVEDSFFDGGHGGCWCGVVKLFRSKAQCVCVCVCVCVCWLAILIYCLVMIFRGTSLLGADVEGRHCRRRCRCRRRS
mmetsp:Transcript_4698/g.10350  ORF Transcript_4698/g.10350 Transcript_4698/m.10350 type:complete len:430 (-) Transcript_4698:5-1294(-)